MRERGLLVAMLLGACACATPQEVKQATIALDDGYRGNLELMRQYRETVGSMNELHRGWATYIKKRILLSLAVEWATMDPAMSDDALKAAQAQLGDGIVAWVNGNRLAGLSARGPLAAGHAKLDDLVQRLPALASLVRRKVEADLAAEKPLQGLAPFDEYARRVATLRNANAAVRAYLGADVTVSRGDVEEIADAIKQLRGAR